MKIKLTPEYIKRITEELKNCQIRLVKELEFSEDLRNLSRIESLRFNINKLQDLLTKKFITV